ncbi:heavy metal translocating P-type ATPase [Arthrobacter roseus]|uniref:heavy metal translocating P-type ATPase n=1 Tax=Arthrobacter roseus TaxID=136274 RepID=UPI001965CF32|nr:cation-translocating P-type ATPase [Arthrobacter roseus]MBM7849494.1 Cd2+/Zn2+-exporting ATPase [Arthrobacter roseus]
MFGTSNAKTAALAGGLLLTAIATQLAGLDTVRDVSLFIAAVVAGIPTAVKAFQALRYKAFSIDLLVTIAVIGALFIGEYVEAAVVSFLFVFGAYLEARTLAKTRQSVRELVDLAPQEAVVRRVDGTATISVDDIAVGDIVVVATGGQIAVDGTIAGGSALVNEATITGESVPARKSMGDQVYSGTLVENGFIDVAAEKTGDDTTFAQIIELVENAQDTKTRAQRFLDRFASIYTPTIIVLSVLVLIFTRNIEFALTFLVIACPGALVISTPVSMVAGLGNGARYGVLVKGGDALERLAKVDALVFDKTGTLTMGRPEVTAVHSLGYDDDALLALAARLEQASEHPLGRTVVQEATRRGLEIGPVPEQVDVVAGGGITGDVDGRTIAVGSPAMATRITSEAGTPTPSGVQDYITDQQRGGNTTVVVLVDSVPAGIISIADRIRPEAREAIAALRQAGISEFHMFTGDNRHTAELVASQLGIDHVQAELLPQDKVRAVTELKARGLRVGMIGDGINDAPAIATADIGVAMGAGTDVSIQTADVILTSNRFDRLVHAYRLSKATMWNMRQNTIIAISTVVVLLAGVLAQRVFMATGMLVHEISVLAVILNAVRLIRFRTPTLASAAPAIDSAATQDTIEGVGVR